MSIFRNFIMDRRGDAMRTVGMAAGAVAIAAVAGGLFLDRATRDGAGPGLEAGAWTRFAQNVASLPRGGGNGTSQSIRQTTVDYTPTGSIPANLAQPIILDPCTGARK